MAKSLFKLVLLALGAFAIWIASTSLAPGPWVATWAPCQRNWGWLDTWHPRRSPLDAVAFRVDHVRGKVCYGRPSLGGRKMIGGAAVPFGKLWRTGANEPTTLHLDAAARLGSLQLTAGSYSIYTIPEFDRWKVVVNRSTRQWGLETEYTRAIQKEEIGRFEVRPEPLELPVETLTIRVAPIATGAVELIFDWEKTRLRVPLVAGFGEGRRGTGDASAPRPNIE